MNKILLCWMGSSVLTSIALGTGSLIIFTFALVAIIHTLIYMWQNKIK